MRQNPTSPDDSRSRGTRASACPKCGKRTFARRSRKPDERTRTRSLSKIIKIRPYQCGACHYQTWKWVEWTASPLLSLGLATGAAVMLGLLAFLGWLIVTPQQSDTSALTIPAATPAIAIASAPTPAPPPAPTQSTPAAEEPPPPPAAPEQLPTNATPPPDELLSASVETNRGRSVLRLQTRQPVSKYRTSLLLEEPTRYVIDIPGRWRLAPGVDSSLSVKLPKIDRISIGTHEDYLRVAIRLRGGYLTYDPVIEITQDGLLVRLN